MIIQWLVGSFVLSADRHMNACIKLVPRMHCHKEALIFYVSPCVCVCIYNLIEHTIPVRTTTRHAEKSKNEMSTQSCNALLKRMNFVRSKWKSHYVQLILLLLIEFVSMYVGTVWVLERSCNLQLSGVYDGDGQTTAPTRHRTSKCQL